MSVTTWADLVVPTVNGSKSKSRVLKVTVGVTINGAFGAYNGQFEARQ